MNSSGDRPLRSPPPPTELWVPGNQIRSKNGRQSRSGEKFLAQVSQLKGVDRSKKILEGQIRECYGRVVYSHKTHEKCADILFRRHARLKLAQILLSAVATAGFVSTLFGSGMAGNIIGGVVSTVLLVLNAYTKNYDLGEVAQKHKQAAANVWFIREQYLSLLTDLSMGERPLNELVEERNRLLLELQGVYSGSPATMDSAYRKAQRALQRDEDLTFSDDEIDAFLPAELKRASPGLASNS